MTISGRRPPMKPPKLAPHQAHQVQQLLAEDLEALRQARLVQGLSDLRGPVDLYGEQKYTVHRSQGGCRPPAPPPQHARSLCPPRPGPRPPPGGVGRPPHPPGAAATAAPATATASALRRRPTTKTQSRCTTTKTQSSPRPPPSPPGWPAARRSRHSHFAMPRISCRDIGTKFVAQEIRM